MKFRFGIMPKLTVIFTVFAALLLVIVSVLSFYSGRSALEKATIAQLESISLEKQASVNDWLGERKLSVAVIAQAPSIVQFTRLRIDDPTDPAVIIQQIAVKNFLSDWVNTSEMFISLSVLDPSTGKVILGTNQADIGKNRGDQLFFINGKQGNYLQPISYSPELQKPVLVVSSPITSSSNELLGVLAGYLNLEELTSIIQRRTGVEQTDDAFLVNALHIIITPPRFLPNPAVLQSGIFTTAVNTCLTLKSGNINANDYRGVPAIIFYRWMPENQMCLIVKIDRSEALAPITLLGRNITIASIILLFAAFLSAYLLSISITKPILRINKGAQEIGKGNLGYRILRLTRDELGQLGHTFNEMSSHLKKSREEADHSRNMLSALSLAAEAVQLSDSPQKVYLTAGTELAKVGLNVSIFSLSEDKKNIKLDYHNFMMTPEGLAEGFARLPAKGLRFAITQGSSYEKTLQGTKALYVASLDSPMSIALKKYLSPKSHGVPGLLPTAHIILVPLTLEQKVRGMVMVSGENLDETDLSAIATFTHQISIALEKNRFFLESRNMATGLERRVQERTRDLQLAIKELGNSRAAALNMMEDAVEAGNELESANIELQKEIRERRKAENEILSLNKELERRVLERTAELADLYNNAPCGYHSLDENEIFERVNDTELKWLGYSRNEFVGKTYFIDLLSPQSKLLYQENLPVFKKRGWIHGMELSMVRKDGSILPVLLSAVAVYDKKGHYLSSRSTVVDNAEQKLSQAKMQEYQTRLEATNRELESFSYSVSHDLRAPLRSMTGFSEALLEEHQAGLDPQGKDYLHRISEAAHRMGRLVDDLLRLSRVTRGEIKKTKVNLSEIAFEITKELQSTSPQRLVKWKITQEICANADLELMKIVLSNLLGNAWKFTGKHKSATIEFGCKKEQDALIYYVKDDGAGFDMQYVSKLFDPFQRLHKREEFDGEGIGLSLVQRIIQRHGGKIWADGQPEVGATFFFTIP